MLCSSPSQKKGIITDINQICRPEPIICSPFLWRTLLLSITFCSYQSPLSTTDTCTAALQGRWLSHLYLHLAFNALSILCSILRWSAKELNKHTVTHLFLPLIRVSYHCYSQTHFIQCKKAEGKWWCFQTAHSLPCCSNSVISKLQDWAACIFYCMCMCVCLYIVIDDLNYKNADTHW